MEDNFLPQLTLADEKKKKDKSLFAPQNFCVPSFRPKKKANLEKEEFGECKAQGRDDSII